MRLLWRIGCRFVFATRFIHHARRSALSRLAVHLSRLSIGDRGSRDGDLSHRRSLSIHQGVSPNVLMGRDYQFLHGSHEGASRISPQSLHRAAYAAVPDFIGRERAKARPIPVSCQSRPRGDYGYTRRRADRLRTEATRRPIGSLRPHCGGDRQAGTYRIAFAQYLLSHLRNVRGWRISLFGMGPSPQ